MGLDIRISRAKPIYCPHCGELVTYRAVDTVDGGGSSWYEYLESIGYYKPYVEGQPYSQPMCGKDMVLNDIVAFIVGNDSDVKFVIGLLGWIGYDAPFGVITDETHPSNYGLWYFDSDWNYCGEWVRVDDQIKKWTDIKNKFEKDT